MENEKDVPNQTAGSDRTHSERECAAALECPRDCAAASAHGEEVSRATIYRCLDRLTAEGAVRKYTAEAGELACYQLCTDAACSNHFHLKCRSCGKLIHLECGMMEDVQKHIAEDHRFVLDPCQTVLYGECEMCAHMHRNHSGK
jgi:Fur family ferric uptake transcriptional regulator